MIYSIKSCIICPWTTQCVLLYSVSLWLFETDFVILISFYFYLVYPSIHPSTHALQCYSTYTSLHLQQNNNLFLYKIGFFSAFPSLFSSFSMSSLFVFFSLFLYYHDIFFHYIANSTGWQWACLCAMACAKFSLNHTHPQMHTNNGKSVCATIY